MFNHSTLFLFCEIALFLLWYIFIVILLMLYASLFIVIWYRMNALLPHVNVYQWFLFIVSFCTSQNRVLIWYGRLDHFFFIFKAKPIFQWVWNKTFLFFPLFLIETDTFLLSLHIPKEMKVWCLCSYHLPVNSLIICTSHCRLIVFFHFYQHWSMLHDTVMCTSHITVRFGSFIL